MLSHRLVDAIYTPHPESFRSIRLKELFGVTVSSHGFTFLNPVSFINSVYRLLSS